MRPPAAAELIGGDGSGGQAREARGGQQRDDVVGVRTTPLSPRAAAAAGAVGSASSRSRSCRACGRGNATTEARI
jgi:hypothetical protein